MNAANRGVVFLVPLLSVFAWGQGEETKVRLVGTVVDQSGGGIKDSRITLYEIGRDDPTAETHPNDNGGKFEFSVKRNRSYRLVAESVCMGPKVVERVDLRSDGDTQLPPIVLKVVNCGYQDPVVAIPDDFGIFGRAKIEYTPAELQRQAELMSLPLARSTIDPHLQFPPVEFQPKIQGARK